MTKSTKSEHDAAVPAGLKPEHKNPANKSRSMKFPSLTQTFKTFLFTWFSRSSKLSLQDHQCFSKLGANRHLLEDAISPLC